MTKQKTEALLKRVPRRAAAPESTEPQVSVETVQRILSMTDLEAHSRRVGEYVAQTAESYRRASARAIQECGQIVLI